MPLLGPTLWLAAAVALGDGKAPTFERDVRPILARRCVPCHAAKHLDAPDVGGGLALDSFAATIKGTGKHRVVSPGDPSASPLLARLTDPDDDRRMPPDEDPIDPASRDLLRRWIDDGAPRGEPTAEVIAVAPKSPTRRVNRSLDVVIPLPPPGRKDAPTALRVKVGPLPSAASLAFLDDGKGLAVGTHGQVVLWDLEKRRPGQVLDDVPGPVLALAASPDGKTLAIGAGLPARSGQVRLYSLPGARFLRALDGHRDVVSALAFRPDGKALASASYDATVRTWDAATGRPLGLFGGHSDFVYDVAYLPDGKSLLSSSKDRTVKRIDAATMAEVRTYGEHNDDVLALAVRPDGSGFVTAGNEPQVRAWGLDSEKTSKKVGAHTGPVHQLAYSRDGKRLASAGGDGSIRVFQGPEPGSPRTLSGPTEWQYAVAVSPDGRRVAGGGWDGLVRVWDADSGTLQMILMQPPSPGAGPSWLAVAPDGAVDGSTDLVGLVRWVVDGKETTNRPRSK
jgi:hypothetical protein